MFTKVDRRPFKDQFLNQIARDCFEFFLGAKLLGQRAAMLNQRSVKCSIVGISLQERQGS